MQLVPAPYLDVLCYNLMQVAERKETRLIINMPPRHLKSLVTSVMWVAWLLMREPGIKVALISHNDVLVVDLAIKCKRLIETAWYQRLAPNVRIRDDRVRTKDFETTRGGGVFSATIESGITGRGFDVIILDDPQAAQDASSEAERERVEEVFVSAISSRLNSPSYGVIVLLQQRLHEDDLSGRLLRKGGWQHLSMPLVAVEETSYRLRGQTWVRPPGDILCPERFPADKIEQLQIERGPRHFVTQYQQAPSSCHGDMIKSEYLKHADRLPTSAAAYFVSIDTAAKALPTSDYTAFLIIATDFKNHYVVDVIRGRFELGQMRDIALRLFRQYRIDKMLIEDSAMGPSLDSLLKEEGYAPKLEPMRGKDKETRLQDVIYLFIEGRVFSVGDAPWTTEFRNELLRFPTGRHDDQVDALTLYLRYVTERQPVKPVHGLVRATGGMGFPNARPLARGEHPMRPRDGRPLYPRRF